MNDYESQRAAKIAKNQALLAELDIEPLGPQQKSRHKRTLSGEPPSKKRRLQRDTAPSRTSARLATATLKPNYTDEPDIKPILLPRSPAAAKSQRKGKPRPIVKEETEPLVPVKDVAEIQSGWSDWTPLAPEPTRDENVVFHFEDHESFTPEQEPRGDAARGRFRRLIFPALTTEEAGYRRRGGLEKNSRAMDQWTEREEILDESGI
jgi:hypothetical protein